ncbi:type I DNA topoisomerase [Caldinitratiruptor microaerophilus]|uniref:DNA topoisomerase 1 n=1 Tax=Caldinitratiruptor microaerophilus TaxID=671077 RepID=A0AA35G5G0_9FIRM|nr:type I DNA topoisomerase [Caldinitratiruptor microaerophilus]BDG59341.1 DNA topoisomerase 1 [Caldinitratiruptor microaerophilus]
MGRSLVIVESPAKAKTIEKFLGRQYQVRASMGHVRDLPRSQLGVDIEHGFSPKYITIRGKGETLKELREQARKADRVLLATDPDREGEAISWHLTQVLGLDSESPCRIEFYEITRDAVQKALKSPRPIDRNRVEAQQARRILDRLVGYKLSPLLWKKVRRGLSAGRVQSVAVRLICDREAEIRAFTPVEYWTVDALLAPGPEEAPFRARYHGKGDEKAELKSEAEARAVVLAVQAGPWKVEAVRRQKRRRSPALPFTTSTMQQEASRRLGFTVRRTMAVAQQLYEGLDLGEIGHVGLVTYIRTDATRIAEEARLAAREFIVATWGEEYAGGEERREEKERPGVQGAHEAIRPTNVTLTPDTVRPYLTPDQYKLYRLIWERFVASQMAPAVLDTVSADIRVGEHLFRASGSAVRFPGFLAVYAEAEDEERPAAEEGHLPDLSEGQVLELRKLIPEQHFTSPPPRYTEAALVKALEERGIGRPSTYAPIIETIQARGYVVKEDKRFVPTELGERVVELLKEYFPEIIDVEFTAHMEAELDRIEEGQEHWQELLTRFYGPFEATLREAEEKIGGFELQDEETDETCPRCGRRLVIKYGRFGRFMACPGFPECKFTKPILEETGVTCPACGQGVLVERRSRKGRRFYGCSRYPECDFVVWQRPVPGRYCPECGGILVERRTREEGLVHACIREECGFREPAPELEEIPS